MSLAWLALAGVQAQKPLCETLYDKYVGFPECRDRMKWVYENWRNPDITDVYVKGGVNGTWCSIQQFLWNEVDSQGKAQHYCPDPLWRDVSDGTTRHADGSVSFLVYRAVNSAATNPYAYKLLNSNAADLGGVLGYVHTEVIPEDMRTAADVAACTRKFGIDSIIVFNVTVKTPPTILQKYGNILGPYSAFDVGKCTGAPAVCDFENIIGAYAPGWQLQGGNPRHMYTTAKWYSFPQCGFCDWPTGEKYCTYTYEVLGKIKIDDIVMLNAAYGNYFNFCKAGKKEYVRIVPTPTNDCLHPNGYQNTTAGLDFWYSPCDKRMCQDRMQRVYATYLEKLDISVKQPGSGPDPAMCPTKMPVVAQFR